MAIIPINSDIKPDEFWQFRPLSIEWIYMMDKLNKSVQAKTLDQHCILGVSPDGTQIYMLKKKFYTITVISKATGLSEEKLAGNTGLITLKSPKSNEGLPDATVEGWGTA